MKKLPNIAKSRQPKVTKATKNPPSFYHLFRHHLSQTEEIHQAFGSTTPGHHIIQLCQDFQVGPMVNWVWFHPLKWNISWPWILAGDQNNHLGLQYQPHLLDLRQPDKVVKSWPKSEMSFLIYYAGWKQWDSQPSVALQPPRHLYTLLHFDLLNLGSWINEI